MRVSIWVERGSCCRKNSILLHFQCEHSDCIGFENMSRVSRILLNESKQEETRRRAVRLCRQFMFRCFLPFLFVVSVVMSALAVDSNFFLLYANEPCFCVTQICCVCASNQKRFFHNAFSSGSLLMNNSGNITSEPVPRKIYGTCLNTVDSMIEKIWFSLVALLSVYYQCIGACCFCWDRACCWFSMEKYLFVAVYTKHRTVWWV